MRIGLVVVVILAILAISLAATGLFGPTVGAALLLCLLTTGLVAVAAWLVVKLKRRT